MSSFKKDDLVRCKGSGEIYRFIEDVNMFFCVLHDDYSDKTKVVCVDTIEPVEEWQPKFTIGDIVKYKGECGMISNARFEIVGISKTKRCYLLFELNKNFGFNHVCYFEEYLELVGNKLQTEQ